MTVFSIKYMTACVFRKVTPSAAQKQMKEIGTEDISAGRDHHLAVEYDSKLANADIFLPHHFAEFH